MKNILIGHRWDKQKTSFPLIIESTACTGLLPNDIRRIYLPYWVLDYDFLPFGKIRVKKTSAPWKSKEARTAQLYPPNTAFWEDTRNMSGKRDSSWIIFTGSPGSEIKKLVESKGYARFLDPEEILGRTIRRCAEIGEQLGEQAFWKVQSTFCEALHIIANSRPIRNGVYEITGDSGSPATPAFSEQVDAFLKEKISEKITMDDITKHMNLSISSLAHKYKEETGFSPMATLIKMRIKYSKALLFKGAPLKAIAVQLGFSDAFHFSKTFKRIEGVSPRNFLKNQHNR